MSDKFYATIKRYLDEFQTALNCGENITHGFNSTPQNPRLQKIVSFWAGKTKPVFVYGTLLKGQKAHQLLEGADYCGKFALQNCAMFDLGDFPGIKRRKGEQVIGEVYFVTEETLERTRRDGYIISIAAMCGGVSGPRMQNLIDLGVSEFTLDRHCSMGLSW